MDDALDVLPPHRIDWGLAFGALVGLAKDTGRTDHVFTIISSLSGGTLERTYQAFKKTEHGQHLLRERTDLMAILSDRARLEAMTEGSLGREYLRFMDRGRITADGLVEAQTAGIDPNARLELDPRRRYVADRLRDMHDLWHVLTEYGADDTGEIANLWFSVGQFGNPGMAFIAFFGVIDGLSHGHKWWGRYCYRAYRRGRNAKQLISEPMEAMLELPIDEARQRLGIASSRETHPDGLRYGYRRDGKLGAPA